jgi:hypothetical protein
MDGKVAHAWRLPYRPGLYGHLLPNGHLLYGGKIMEDLERFEAWPRFKGGAVLEVDWNGRVLWEVRHPDSTTATFSCCVCVPYPPSSRAAFREDCPGPRQTARCTPTISSR